MTRKITMLATAALAVAACGKEKSLEANRDTMAAPDTLTPIADAPALTDTMPRKTPPETVFVSKPSSPPVTKPKPKPTTSQPAPSPAPAPAPPPAAPSRPAALTSGSTFTATAIDSVHSRYTKVGDQFHVRVRNDVTSSEGKVVIPAGSVVTLSVVEIAPAPNRGEKGTLVLSARNVEINGSSYPITARASDYQYEMKARGVGAGEVAKTAGGAAAGAIIGRVIGGKTGTVVGAVGGGAAGAAIAAKSADRDIIVHAGNSVTLTLRDDFTRQ